MDQQPHADRVQYRSLVDLQPPLQLLLGEPPVEFSQEHLLRRPAVAPLHRAQSGGFLVQSSRHLTSVQQKEEEEEEGAPVDHTEHGGWRWRRQESSCTVCRVNRVQSIFASSCLGLG